MLLYYLLLKSNVLKIYTLNKPFIKEKTKIAKLHNFTYFFMYYGYFERSK